MTIKGILLGAILLIFAIASTMTIFKIFQTQQQMEVEIQNQSQSIQN